MNNDFISNTPNPRYQAAFRRPTPPRPQAPHEPPEPPEALSAPENFSPARKKPSPIPIIICIVLAIAGITFGVIEFLKNSELKTEIEDLKTKISGLETKPEEKPEKEEEKPYSGTTELKYRIDFSDEEPKPADSPTGKAYSINLDYDTGKLQVEIETLGVMCPDDCIEKKEVTLTQQELGKIYYINNYKSYEYIEIKSAFAASNYTTGETFESILTKLVYDDRELATKENSGSDNWEEISDYDIDNDDILTYREYSNKILDDILFEIYGWVNCMPGTEENPETNCGGEKDNCAYPAADCDGGPEGTDCGAEPPELILPHLDCETAKEIDYPYIAY